MEAEYELTLRDYLDILRRRALLMAGVFSFIFALAVVFSIVRPPVYESSGTILIESQQISPDIISTTVSGYAIERIEVIKQRVMTRENLLRIIEKYGLFVSKEQKLSTTELVNLMRNSINIDLLGTGRGGRANIAFSIAFKNRHPQLAYEVTNELVTLFLDENVKSRVERATETTEFLAQEAKRLKADLEQIESQVAAYKQQNADALPEHLDMKIEMVERAQRTLADLDREYKSKEVELSRLELELANERSASGSDTALTELETLKAEYRRASALYTENHPTVRMLKHKIEALNKAAKENGGQNEELEGIYNTVLATRLQTRIKTVKSEMQSIKEQTVPLKGRIADLEAQIIRTPQVELGLSSLLRDHGNAKEKYEEIQAKQLSAKVAENLEEENKSERFTLIDPPLFPDKPIEPNRKKIILLGLILAIGSAGGFAFLLEMLNQKIRGHGALTTVLGQSPLVEIPYIKTADEVLQRKKLIIRISIGLAVFLIISLIIIHFTYMSLDILLIKILARF